jgi:gamma-glutamyltranspeptidase/glutathione hydrolase
LSGAIADEPELKRDPEARALYFDAAGNPWPAGTVLHNPAYAETLRALQERGADAFYAGPIAQAIIAEVNADVTEGGTPRMVAADLIDYRARERATVCGPYRTYTVCSMGPPTSGGIAMLQILGILQGFPLSNLEPDGPQALHLIAEASRLAFADRDRYVADADFARVPVKSLLDPTYLKARAGQIRTDRSLGEARPGKFSDPMIVAQASQRQFEPASTSHFVIVDSAGDIVSMTSSVEMAFGSHRMVGGFILNNQLTDFSFLPATEGRQVANRVEPGKRPRSSMTPTIVFDAEGKPAFALGSPGGSSIIGYVTHAVIELIDWKRSPGAAAAAPHIINRNGPTVIEAGTTLADLTPALEQLGHEVKESALKSGLNIVEFQDGVMIGASDPRRDGVALAE